MEDKMIELKPFDKEFYESLPEKEKIEIKENGKYHLILSAEGKAGIVGFIPLRTSDEEGFIQIILLEKFRGKNILKDAEGQLVRKYKLKRLYATVDDDNLASIKSHEKIGFEKLPNEKLEELRNKNFLKENQIRLVKDY
jgi:RimJ/RimL family protein N-acetyltransferase